MLILIIFRFVYSGKPDGTGIRSSRPTQKRPISFKSTLTRKSRRAIFALKF